MPTGHHVMQRPQPTQPERPELVDPRRELVGQPLAVAVRGRDRKLPPATLAKPALKHESQLRSAVEAVPVEIGALDRRSCRSRSGRPSVQFAHVRQRSATSRPAGAVELGEQAVLQAHGLDAVAASPSRAAPTAPMASAVCSDARDVGSRARSARPAVVAASDEESAVEFGKNEVGPPRTSGPVPIEVQKQVAAAVVHWTAMTSGRRPPRAGSRRRRTGPPTRTRSWTERRDLAGRGRRGRPAFGIWLVRWRS